MLPGPTLQQGDTVRWSTTGGVSYDATVISSDPVTTVLVWMETGRQETVPTSHLEKLRNAGPPDDAPDTV